MNPLTGRPLPRSLGDLAAIARWRASTSGTGSEAPIDVLTSDSAELCLTAAAVAGALLGKDAATVTADAFDQNGRLDHGNWMEHCASIRDQIQALSAVEARAEAAGSAAATHAEEPGAGEAGDSGRPHTSAPSEPIGRRFPTSQADVAGQLLDTLPEGLRAQVARIRDLPGSATPALLDGPVPAAAALLAHRFDADVLEWVRPLQAGATPTEVEIWNHLRLTPIVPLRTRINDGTLAPVAEAVLRLAIPLAQAALDAADEPPDDPVDFHEFT